MDEHDWLVRRFEEQHPRLRAVAYRMLGSRSEADDAVQEAWLRLNRSDADGVENLGGWLTTVVGVVLPDGLTEVRGARAVAEQALIFSRFAPSARPALVNGVVGIVSRSPEGRPFSVMGFTVRGEKIVEIDILADPVRLRRLDLSGHEPPGSSAASRIANERPARPAARPACPPPPTSASRTSATDNPPRGLRRPRHAKTPASRAATQRGLKDPFGALGARHPEPDRAPVAPDLDGEVEERAAQPLQ